MSHNVSQRKRSKVTVQPVLEPVTLQELKNNLSINDNEFDTFLTSLIPSARNIAEQYLGRKLITQTLTMYMDRFGVSGEENIWEGTRIGSINWIQADERFSLEFLPILSITAITTFSIAEVESTVASTNYRLENFDDDMEAEVALVEGGVWPHDLRDSSGVKVVYVAGYGANRTDVPAVIRQAILMIAAFMFTNRGDCTPESSLNQSGAQEILSVYEVLQI